MVLGRGPGRLRAPAAAPPRRRPQHVLPDRGRRRLQLHGRPLHPRHPVPGPRRRPGGRPPVGHHPQGRRQETPRRGVLVPAALLGRRRRPPAGLPRPGDPDRRPGSRLPARLRPRRHQARRQEVLRGGPEVLPVLGHRDRGEPHGHQLRVRLHRHPLPHPGRRTHPARRRTAPHPRPDRRRPHPGRLRLQDGRRPLPLLGARHLRGRASPDRRLLVGRRQGGRLLRSDPRHRRRAALLRRRLGPGARRAGRPHHDRRQCRRPPPAGHARVQRGTAARLVLRGPGRLPPRADRRRRVLRRRGAVRRLHRRLRPHVRRREPRRLRGGRAGGPYEGRQPHLRLPRPLREQPDRRAPPGLLPALPRRAAAGHHRPVRQGHRLLGSRGRGPGLARRGHGRQRRDRAVLLPPSGRRCCSGLPRANPPRTACPPLSPLRSP
ncbi:hypothetical protein RKD25_003479 [Streptomyces sp. SAI-124]